MSESEAITEAGTTAPLAMVSRVAIAIALLALAIRLYLLFTTRSTAEDFYITLRYAENIATGQGFVFNPGERVLGATTPLYTLMLAAFHWMGADASLSGKLLNTFADSACCWLLYRLGRGAGKPGVGLFAAALYALSPPSLTWAISGMETGLVTCAGLAVFVAAIEKRATALAICSAALILLRIDGLILVAFGLASLWVTTRRVPVKPLALTAALIAPWTIFAFAYFGSPVPQSAVSKVVVYGWHAKSAYPNIAPFLDQMTHSMPHKLIAGLALIGLVTVALRVRMLLPAALWMLTHYAAMALSKVFLFGWYYIPPSPLYFLMAAVGAGTIASALLDRASRQETRAGQHAKWALAGSAIVLLVGLKSIPAIKQSLRDEQVKEDRTRKAIGLDLRERMQSGSKLMLEPIGYVGYFAQANVLDTVGLVSPEVLKYYRADVKHPYLEMMRELKPEWALLRTGEYDDYAQAINEDLEMRGSEYQLVTVYQDPEAPANSRPMFYLLHRARSRS
jgi:hypothetical protein